MCGSHVHPIVLCVILSLDRLVVEAQKYVFGINKRDDTVEVYRAAQTIVDPEKGSEIAGVGETGCFEEDIVKGASAGHEGLDGIDTGVFDGAADAAVGQLEPFLRFLTVLGDCESSFDIGSCMENVLGEPDSGTD